MALDPAAHFSAPASQVNEFGDRIIAQVSPHSAPRLNEFGDRIIATLATPAPATAAPRPAARPEPSLMQSVGAGLKELITNPLDFSAEAIDVFSPARIKAGLGAMGAAINPEKLLGEQGKAIRAQAAAEVMAGLPRPARPVVSAVGQAFQPLASLTARGIGSQETGQGLAELVAALEQGRRDAGTTWLENLATTAGSLGTQVLMLGGAGRAAPALMGAMGVESGIQQNLMQKEQAAAEGTEQQDALADIINIGGQAALNYLFGKLLPGQKLNDAIIKRYAPQLMKESAGAIQRTLLQAGVNASEGVVFQLASNALRKIVGQDVPLSEGVIENALISAGLGAGLQGIQEFNRPRLPQTPPVAQEPSVPPLLARMILRSRERENQGQPIVFESAEEKANYVLSRKDLKGKVVDESRAYLEQLRAFREEQAVQIAQQLAQQREQQGVQPTTEEPTGALGSGAAVPVPKTSRAKPVPSEDVRSVADSYAKEAGIDYRPNVKYVKVDKSRAKRIADWYEKAESTPNDPAVKASYDALKKETLAQYQQIIKAGYKVEPWTKEGPAYKSSAEMIKDVRENKHLYYKPTSKTGFGRANEGISGHPMMETVDLNGQQVPFNDLFRVVHDFFGYAKEGVGFGPRGEENAWRQHVQMFSDAAKPAMTTETRGQNSWVNFGPEGAKNRAKPAKTVYAVKKATLAPDWVVKEGGPVKGGVKPAPRKPIAEDQERIHEAGLRERTGVDKLKETEAKFDQTAAETGAPAERAAERNYSVTDADVKEAIQRATEGSPKIGRTYTPKPPATAEQARFARDLRKATGIRVTWYEGSGTGFNDPVKPGVVHLNRVKVNSEKKLQLVGAHELMHALKKLRPGLFDQMMAAIPKKLREKIAAEYLAAKKAAGLGDVANLHEESVAVPFGELSTGRNVLRMIRGENPTLYDKIVRFFREIAAKLGHGESKSWLAAMRVWEQLLDAPLTPGSDYSPTGFRPDYAVTADDKDRPRPLSLRVKDAEGREMYKQEDVRREAAGEPASKSDTALEAAAQKIADRGELAIRELIEKGNRGELYTDAETVAVRKIIDTELPKAMKSRSVYRIAQLGELIAADRKVGTEAGRAFRQRRDPISPAMFLQRTLAEALAVPPSAEGATPTKAERIAFLKKVKEHLEKNGLLDQLTPENLSDPVWVSKRINELSTLNPKGGKIYELFLASILSGPQTQERNLVGNMTNFALHQGVLRPVEMMINSFVKDPNAAQWGEWKYIFRNMGPRIQAAWANAIQSFKAERAIFQGRIVEGHADLLRGPAISGRKGEIIRTPLRLLTAVDQFMKTIVGFGEVGARAYRRGKAKGFKNNSPEMEAFIKSEMDNPDSGSWKEAHEYAKAVTFQDESGPFTKSLINLRESVTVPGIKPVKKDGKLTFEPVDIRPLRYIVIGPFLRIAGKLEAATWRYTPFGSLAIAGRGLAGQYKGNAPRLVRDLASQVVAWTLFGALYGASGDDKVEPWITGSTTKESREQAYRTAPPLSIRLPGYGWVSYKHLQPLSGAIATMVDMIEGMKAMKKGQSFNEAFGTFIQKAKNRIADQTFLQSLGDAMSAMDSPDRAATFLSNFGASWVPNLIRQPLYQADEKVRESRALEDTSMFDQLARRSLPGVYKALPRVTPWGEEVTRPGNAVERMFSPFTRYDSEPNPADAVIAKWNFAHPENPYYVNVPRPVLKVGDEFAKMTEREYYLYLRLGGLLASRSVNNMQSVRSGVANATTIDGIQRAREAALEKAAIFIRTAIAHRKAGRTDQYNATLDRVRNAISRMEQ